MPNQPVPLRRPHSERIEPMQHNSTTSERTSSHSRPLVAVLYENESWQHDLFAALEDRGIGVEGIQLQDAAFHLDETARHTIYINRISPSSYIRGHDRALKIATTYLETLEAQGVRVINGAPSFSLEVSKVRQHLLLKRLGVRTPRTVVFNNRQRVRELAQDFPFPAILKPDTGGSGALVRRLESREHLEKLLDEDESLFGNGQLLLLQEWIKSADGRVLRTEFVDGELVFAMRVLPRNTFNLCPALSCERRPAEPHRADAQPEVEFGLFDDIEPAAIAQAREIVREARLDVGGVEYLETANGERVFFDINATSVYRPDIEEQAGVVGMDMFLNFVERELLKEHVKQKSRDLRPRRRVS